MNGLSFSNENIRWYFDWVSKSLNEGFGTNVGWEWYHPTTWYPFKASLSDAIAWDTKINNKSFKSFKFMSSSACK